jgi:hypothetical protein
VWGNTIDLLARLVSNIGARHFGSPFFDVGSVRWPCADPILSHSGGLGITAERMGFGRNWDWRHSVKNGLNAPLKTGI